MAKMSDKLHVPVCSWFYHDLVDLSGSHLDTDFIMF